MFALHLIMRMFAAKGGGCGHAESTLTFLEKSFSKTNQFSLRQLQAKTEFNYTYFSQENGLAVLEYLLS